MKANWTPLTSELAQWRNERRVLPFWWRDDDAIEDTPALRRLLQFSDNSGVPIHLAVIPKPAQPSLVALCAQHSNVVPVVHGWTHQNNAPEGEKKAEFGHPRAGAEAELVAGMSRMEDLFGKRLFRMFVPPWNRVDTSVLSALKSNGFIAVSAFTPRTLKQIEGVAVLNTHVDPIHWKAGGGLVDEDLLINGIVELLQNRRLGHTDAAEPLGILTHHLVHDDAIWAFTERCISVLLEGGATPCNLREMKDLP